MAAAPCPARKLDLMREPGVAPPGQAAVVGACRSGLAHGVVAVGESSAVGANLPGHSADASALAP
jgi:hypothetical protein